MVKENAKIEAAWRFFRVVIAFILPLVVATLANNPLDTPFLVFFGAILVALDKYLRATGFYGTSN